jgi:hypothetical protein
MKIFAIVVSALTFAPAFSTKAMLPSHLRRLNPSNTGSNQGRPGQEGGNQEWPGQDGAFGQVGLGQVGGLDFAEDSPELVVIQCDATDACDLPDGEVGSWACRMMMTDPFTGETRSVAICIPKDEAWNTGKFKQKQLGAFTAQRLTPSLSLDLRLIQMSVDAARMTKVKTLNVLFLTLFSLMIM